MDCQFMSIYGKFMSSQTAYFLRSDISLLTQSQLSCYPRVNKYEINKPFIDLSEVLLQLKPFSSWKGLKEGLNLQSNMEAELPVLSSAYNESDNGIDFNISSPWVIIYINIQRNPDSRHHFRHRISLQSMDGHSLGPIVLLVSIWHCCHQRSQIVIACTNGEFQ